ncbi:MAG: hypothetical protein RR626_04740, partial [Anaerovoracaceae bacterium]
RLSFQYFTRVDKLGWWCGIALLSSMCRYGLLKWIPTYYALDTGKQLLGETFSNILLPAGMAFGTLLLTWIGGTLLKHNKGVVIVWAAALSGALIIIFPMTNNPTVVLVGIFFTGFFLYGINGMLWLYAIETGCRYFSGRMTGVLNCCAYLGATLESFIFPAVIRMTEEIISVFILMEALCVGMIVLGMIVSNKNTVIEPEVKE